jgi:hypothetical protein
MRKSEDEFKRKLEQMQKQIEFLMLSSDVDPEKVNRLHALEEDKRDQAYAEAQEENEREIPVSELTKEEQAEFDRRVKECKKSQKGSNSAANFFYPPKKPPKILIKALAIVSGLIRF